MTISMPVTSAARPSATATHPRVETGFGRTMTMAMLASGAMLTALIAWSALTMISGAVIVEGQTVVQGQPRDLQHLDGGIVTAINVKNGDMVQEGDVLLTLDPTVLRVNLDIALNRLAEDLAKQARLQAEQRGAASIDADGLKSTDAAAWLGGRDLDGPLRGQAQIMTARAEVLAGQRESLTEKKAQFDKRATGLDALIAALQEQVGYMDRDIANMQQLTDKGLGRESPLLSAKGSRAEILGEIAQYQSERDGIVNSVRDAEIAAAQAEREFHEKVVTDLGDVTAEIGELVLQVVTTTKQLERVEMRAPATGIVHEMKASTIGGVISPGQTVAQIVPTGEGMEFEMQLPARSIESTHPGQTARLRLTAMDQVRTPELRGEVRWISPTSIMDDKTGQSFYRVRVVLPPEELARLGGEKLIAGMPVEGYLETGMRSALDWLVQPLTHHLNRAFREK